MTDWIIVLTLMVLGFILLFYGGKPFGFRNVVRARIESEVNKRVR